MGIKYCAGLITVKSDADEQFFDYGYDKDNSKLLHSTKKLRIPSSFKSTVFGVHKMQYEGGAFTEQDSSEIFFYLPSTVDKRNADAFLSAINHDNEKLLWPGGKRTKSDKFALTY